MGYLGHLAVVLALLAALGGAIASFAGRVQWGRRAALITLGSVTLATGTMVAALVTHDFSVKYVVDVGSRETPLYYTIISLWGALEGSILFWAFLLSLYTVGFTFATRVRYPDIQPYATGILLVISSYFLFVIAWPGDPFRPVSPVPADGSGPNVLLQNHWMMGVHPPLLYLGYVGLSVPYAVAMASLISGGPNADVFRLIRRWSLIPWVFLSLGIVGGMWWSYAVLGWGGYWSWDPVENASVMPWLVTTAFLHSLQVQERRGMLKTWTMSLIIAAFLLSILGTFLTRSGVLASVHSFTQSSIGPLFLAFFASVLVLSLGLLFARSHELAAPGALEAAVCRETVFLFNNLLLVAITFTILLGTLFPIFAEALQGAQLSVGAPYFNHVSVPAGFALLFLMGIGPVLPWGAGRLEDLQYRLLPATGVGVATVLLLLVIGVRGVGALLTFGASSFVLAITVGRISSDIRVRHGNTNENWLVAMRRLLSANPRRYGGYLAHVGVLLMVIGIAASQSYGVRTSATLRPGDRMAIAGYNLTYLGFLPHGESNRMVLGARVSVTRGVEKLGNYLPALNVYPGQQQPVVTPAVREEPLDMILGLRRGRSPLPDLGQLLQGRNPFEDLYIVLQAVNANMKHPEKTAVTMQVLVNPMVGCIWLGGMLVGLGGLCALMPSRRRRRVAAHVIEAGPVATHEAMV